MFVNWSIYCNMFTVNKYLGKFIWIIYKNQPLKDCELSRIHYLTKGQQESLRLFYIRVFVRSSLSDLCCLKARSLNGLACSNCAYRSKFPLFSLKLDLSWPWVTRSEKMKINEKRGNLCWYFYYGRPFFFFSSVAWNYLVNSQGTRHWSHFGDHFLVST